MLSDAVLIQIVIGVVAVVTTYLTVKYKDKILQKPHPKSPDRMENIFDGYDKLIHRQEKTINSLEKSVARLEDELEATRKDLLSQRQMNMELKDQLAELKRSYGVK